MKRDDYYSFGQDYVLEVLGLKTANAPPAENPDSGLSLGQGAAVAGATALPFAGLIGQKPIIHDPLLGAKGKKARSMADLGRMSMPGDVLITTKPKGSLWKNFIAPFSGSEFYHAQPIVGMTSKGDGLTGTAGENMEAPFKDMSLKELKRESNTVSGAMKADGYTDAVLLRPKNTNAATRKQLAQANLERTKRKYDTPQAIRAWLKELVVPKIPGLENLGAKTMCEGNVCSTMPAMVMEDVMQQGVVPGKAAKDVFPTDFLRSENFELVGSRVNPNRYTMNPKLRKALPYLTRGGLGLGAGAATYATTEEPELAGAAAGAAGAGMGTQALLRRRFGADNVEKQVKALPDTFSMMADMMDPTEKGRLKTLKGWASKRVPLLAGGALAGYGAAHGLKHLLSKEGDE